MRDNVDLMITGSRVVLVPYRPEHVETYHAWMQDPALQEATASEPLTLEQEHDMQRSWAADDDKCTFIVLDRDLPGTRGGGMAGDCNLFFNDHDDAGVAEIEIMIAEPASRRKGLAREALTLFMAWSSKHLGVTRFRAKIGDANAASLALFRQLGYEEVSRSAVFKEVTLELPVAGAVADQLAAAADQLRLSSYDAAEG